MPPHRAPADHAQGNPENHAVRMPGAPFQRVREFVCGGLAQLHPSSSTVCVALVTGSPFLVTTSTTGQARKRVPVSRLILRPLGTAMVITGGGLAATPCRYSAERRLSAHPSPPRRTAACARPSQDSSPVWAW
jgi:hypothetical protein